MGLFDWVGCAGVFVLGSIFGSYVYKVVFHLPYVASMGEIVGSAMKEIKEVRAAFKGMVDYTTRLAVENGAYKRKLGTTELRDTGAPEVPVTMDVTKA